MTALRFLCSALLVVCLGCSDDTTPAKTTDSGTSADVAAGADTTPADTAADTVDTAPHPTTWPVGDAGPYTCGLRIVDISYDLRQAWANALCPCTSGIRPARQRVKIPSILSCLPTQIPLLARRWHLSVSRRLPGAGPFARPPRVFGQFGVLDVPCGVTRLDCAGARTRGQYVAGICRPRGHWPPGCTGRWTSSRRWRGPTIRRKVSHWPARWT
jgi:hypothetical protein